mmetsp:Transcript_13176/g.31850  ORF Transcript_13176/g.31850 Transcript_13176/m.31850 type:complete len:214 (+) Transcript_13176:1151-1792(+)
MRLTGRRCSSTPCATVMRTLMLRAATIRWKGPRQCLMPRMGPPPTCCPTPLGASAPGPGTSSSLRAACSRPTSPTSARTSATRGAPGRIAIAMGTGMRPWRRSRTQASNGCACRRQCAGLLATSTPASTRCGPTSEPTPPLDPHRSPAWASTCTRGATRAISSATATPTRLGPLRCASRAPWRWTRGTCTWRSCWGVRARTRRIFRSMLVCCR